MYGGTVSDLEHQTTPYLRVDLPTIGLKTLSQSKTAGLKGIVIKNKQHVFLDKSKCIKFANKNRIFISVK